MGILLTQSSGYLHTPNATHVGAHTQGILHGLGKQV
jgi:hypothetical protein